MEFVKKIASIILFLPVMVLVLVFAFNNNTYASASLTERQEELNRQTQDVREALYGVNEQMTATHQQIYDIESNLLQVVEELEFISSQLETTRATLTVVSEDLENAIEVREEQQERLVRRARVMYMNGPITYLDVLLSSANFTDLLMRMEFVNRIVEHDQNLVNDLLETEAIIYDSYNTIVVEEQRLMALELQESTRMDQYESAITERMTLVSTLESEERYLLQQMLTLERNIIEVENLIRSQNRANRATAQPSSNRVIVDVSNLSGQLAWPVPGRTTISSPYGPRRSPISGRNEFHSGIDIPAPSGTNFIASDSGVVIFSGWKNGFGNTIIIDHGDGISTLYAHNSRNTVSVGESVVAGQGIGTIGSTGFSTGPHSHFEVRINGSHVDPMSFLN